MLLDAGANVDHTDSLGRTGLLRAAWRGHDACIKVRDNTVEVVVVIVVHACLWQTVLLSVALGGGCGGGVVCENDARCGS